MSLTDLDMQRAAVLVVHHARRDIPGLNRVLIDTTEDGRTSELLLGLCELYRQLLPVLCTPAGIGLLDSVILGLATGEGEK
jgi:hypothetical protein